MFSDSDDEGEVTTDLTEGGGTGEAIAMREDVVRRDVALSADETSSTVTTASLPPAADSGRPLIGSAFSRSSRTMARRKSQAELWSIDHVAASDKWIAQQVCGDDGVIGEVAVVRR